MASTLISGLAVAAPAMAQDQDVVTVTGSRIQRTDTIAPSPVTNVSAEQLAVVNTVNTEDFINTLPQVVPAFDSTSNNPGDGTATVSLRGLGTTRTLVLVDGQRFVGSSVNNVVDLNNIPAAMVASIDIVTGGASAVYGSDAVAGVVNFIMKDDFEGVEINASTETSLGDLDGTITNVSVTMGGNFDNGRGNAVISLGYTNREALFSADRDFSSVVLWDPGAGNEADGWIYGGSSNIPGTRIRGGTTNSFGLDQAALTAFDPNCLGNCSGFRVDSGGNVRGYRSGGSPNDTYNYGPTNYLQLPQERYNISAFATYEVNEHLEFYGRGVFANNVVDSQLAPTPAGVTLTVNLDNPNLPAALLGLIVADPGSNNGDGTGTVRISRRFEEFGTRNSLRDTSSFQAVFGARGNLNADWSYDAFMNYSRSSVSQIQTGNLSVSALQAGVLCDGGPTALASGCTAAYADVFGGPGAMSAASVAQIAKTGAQIDTMEAFQTMATLSGSVPFLQSPAAHDPLAIVMGVEYRESSADSRPDSVLGPDVRGFNQALPVGGSFDVYEFFAEVEMPLIEDRPMIQSLALNAAFRSSDYSTVGQTETFAVGLGWELNDQIRLRGNFNRAVRAPNVGDLFQPLVNGFPGAQDPCAGGANGSYGAGTIDATCTAAGVPAAQIGADFQGNAQMEALFGGNPGLGSETADTYTVGVVLTPAAIEGLTVTLDYYNISIEDVITTLPLQTLLDECHLSGIASSCAALAGSRNPATGEMGANGFLPALTNINAAVLDSEGVDLRIDYGFDAGVMGLPGDMAVTYYGGYTITSDFTNSATSPVTVCAGFYGLSCGEPTPEYKHTVQTSWYTGPFTTSLRWRYIGAVEADSSTAPYVSTFSDHIDGTSYFDVTFQYDINDTFTVNLGVTNFTDTDVPAIGSTASEQANTWPATYETLGRRLFVGGTMRF
ncbi:TonB-dependent receptor plug domain-containing protein [Maricaulis sp.]|uniref:TonB-dependent receptor plug domain-containing protein n=1 Tax=Maricaulis sp. TaxID=1486257 RepID=UPI003A8E7561